jgi:LacI family transcriptional regulator
MVTLKHIANEAGVSAGAVSKVLNGRATEARISPSRAAQINAIARRLNYHPNAAARTMRSRRTGHVGVLIANAPEDPGTCPQAYYTIVGVNIGLEEAGYVLSLVRITDVSGDRAGRALNPLHDHSASRVFRERMLDGLIVTTHVPAVFAERIERLVPTVVWADANVWRPTDCIRRDEYHAGRTATEGLLAAGYRRVVWHGTFDAAFDTHYSHADRLAGVRDAAAEGGVGVVAVKTNWQWQPALVAEYRPLLRPDTAVVAEDVLHARMVAHAAFELRRAPGVDFGLACCEDTPELTNTWPDLARVEFDRHDLGRRAAAMMVARLGDPEAACESYRLRGRWIPGPTAGRPGRSGAFDQALAAIRAGAQPAAAAPVAPTAEIVQHGHDGATGPGAFPQ